MIIMDIKGKRQAISLAQSKLIKYFESRGVTPKLSIPEYYYHCSANSSVSIGMEAEIKYLDKIDLDKLDLGKVSVTISNLNFSPPIALVKPLSKGEFIVRRTKAKKDIIYESVHKEYKGSTSIKWKEEEEDYQLRDDETLEEYEQRLYG